MHTDRPVPTPSSGNGQSTDDNDYSWELLRSICIIKLRVRPGELVRPSKMTWSVCPTLQQSHLRLESIPCKQHRFWKFVTGLIQRASHITNIPTGLDNKYRNAEQPKPIAPCSLEVRSTAFVASSKSHTTNTNLKGLDLNLKWSISFGPKPQRPN